MNIKPLIDAVEILEEAKLATLDEKDRLEIGHAIFKVRCVLQKHGVFLGGAEKPESATDQTASAVNKARMDKEAAHWREATEMAEAWCQTKDPYRRDREVYCYRAGYLKSMREAEKNPEPPATFIPKPPSPEVQEMWTKINEATARVVHENNLRIEELTEAQCTQAIIQAFQCGDFKRLVRASDNAQQVVYMPFAEVEALKSELNKMKTTHQPGDPEMRWDEDFGWLHVSVLDEINEMRTTTATLLDPSAVWTNMLRGTIAMPQAVEHGRECQSQLEQICNALDGYWRTHPDTLSAVQAAVADANTFRLALSRLMEKFTGATLDNVVDVVCAYATTADGQLKLMESIKSAPCVTRVSVNDEGHAFVVYLRDGKKITVGRGSRTIGPAWLEVLDQTTLKAL